MPTATVGVGFEAMVDTPEVEIATGLLRAAKPLEGLQAPVELLDEVLDPVVRPGHVGMVEVRQQQRLMGMQRGRQRALPHRARAGAGSLDLGPLALGLLVRVTGEPDSGSTPQPQRAGMDMLDGGDRLTDRADPGAIRRGLPLQDRGVVAPPPPALELTHEAMANRQVVGVPIDQAQGVRQTTLVWNPGPDLLDCPDDLLAEIADDSPDGIVQCIADDEQEVADQLPLLGPFPEGQVHEVAGAVLGQEGRPRIGGQPLELDPLAVEVEPPSPAGLQRLRDLHRGLARLTCLGERAMDRAPTDPDVQLLAQPLGDDADTAAILDVALGALAQYPRGVAHPGSPAIAERAAAVTTPVALGPSPLEAIQAKLPSSLRTVFLGLEVATVGTSLPSFFSREYPPQGVRPFLLHVTTLRIGGSGEFSNT